MSDQGDKLKLAAQKLCVRTMPFGHVVGNAAKGDCVICGYHGWLGSGDGAPRFDLDDPFSTGKQTRSRNALKKKCAKLARKLARRPELKPFIRSW